MVSLKEDKTKKMAESKMIKNMTRKLISIRRDSDSELPREITLNNTGPQKTKKASGRKSLKNLPKEAKDAIPCETPREESIIINKRPYNTRGKRVKVYNNDDVSDEPCISKRNKRNDDPSEAINKTEKFEVSSYNQSSEAQRESQTMKKKENKINEKEDMDNSTDIEKETDSLQFQTDTSKIFPMGKYDLDKNKGSEVLKHSQSAAALSLEEKNKMDLSSVLEISKNSPLSSNRNLPDNVEPEKSQNSETVRNSQSQTYYSSDEDDNDSQEYEEDQNSKKAAIWDDSPLYIPRIKLKHDEIVTKSDDFRCSVCLHQASDFFQLKQHLMEAHPSVWQSQSSCDVCELFFQSNTKLELHLATSHGPQNKSEFPCPHCDKSYNTNKLLNWHLSFAHKLSKKHFSCKKCDFEAQSILELRKHNNATHRGRKNCEFCGKTFNFFCHLKTHLETVHKKSNDHACEFCGKVFYHSRYLKQHLKRHTGEKTHVCHLCNAAFYESNTLKAHIETHSEPKDRKYRFICSYCGSKYNNKTNFEEHLNKHTGNKPHHCHFCEKRFGFKSLLSQHIKFSHSDEKPHKCSICDKSFKMRVRLHQHMTVHTRVSKHACEFCHKPFTCNTSLKKHLQICKYRNNPLSKEETILVPKTEITDENMETQILIVDMGQQDSGEVTQFTDIKLENIETEELTDVYPASAQEELFVCSECNTAFVSLELAQEHILTTHN